jgi:hypothetical protein
MCANIIKTSPYRLLNWNVEASNTRKVSYHEGPVLALRSLPAHWRPRGFKKYSPERHLQLRIDFATVSTTW